MRVKTKMILAGAVPMVCAWTVGIGVAIVAWFAP